MFDRKLKTYQQIIEQMADGVCLVTLDNKVALWNGGAEAEGIKSVLALPIIAKGKVIGVLRLLTNVHRTFSQDEIDFTMALAEQCGIAIENARMYEKLHSANMQ